MQNALATIGVIIIFVAVVGGQFWWKYRPVKRARTIRAEASIGQPAWLVELEPTSTTDLLATQDNDLMMNVDVLLESTAAGLKFTPLYKGEPDDDLPPAVVPWNVIVRAQLIREARQKSAREAVLYKMAYIGIAISDRWYEEFTNTRQGESDFESDDESTTPQSTTSPAEIEEAKQDYDDMMSADWGDLYARGVEILGIASYDATGLVDAINSRASGRPEEALD